MTRMTLFHTLNGLRTLSWRRNRIICKITGICWQLNGELLGDYSELTIFALAGRQLLRVRPEIESGFQRIGMFRSVLQFGRIGSSLLREKQR